MCITQKLMKICFTLQYIFFLGIASSKFGFDISIGNAVDALIVVMHFFVNQYQ